MFNLEQLSVSELQQLITDAQKILNEREQATSPMRVRVSFPAYNWRRYSKPWIAKVVSWPVGSKPDIEWGTFLGSAEGGEVEIAARPGDIIRYGQKDDRGNGSTSNWAIVQEDGSLQMVSEPEARQAYKGA